MVSRDNEQPRARGNRVKPNREAIKKSLSWENNGLASQVPNPFPQDECLCSRLFFHMEVSIRTLMILSKLKGELPFPVPKFSLPLKQLQERSDQLF